MAEVYKYWDLIQKKRRGSINSVEQLELDQWAKSSAANMLSMKRDEKIWELSSKYKDTYEPNVELGLSKLKKRMKADLEVKSEAKIKRINPMFSFLKIAASIVLLVGIGMVSRNYFSSTTPWNTAVASNGQKHKVDLPDGSIVWINENSTLDFPNQFTDNQRLVKLKGEAFFEVARNEAKPFIIETKETSIQVLGTSFNVRANNEEGFTEVVVKTGKVQFKENTNQKTLILEANQKAIYNHSSKKFKETTSKNINEAAWQSNKLIFKDTRISEVFSDLEKHFKVNIKTKNSKLLDCSFTSTFPSAQLKDILATIELSFNWEVKKINKNSFEVSGKKCK